MSFLVLVLQENVSLPTAPKSALPGLPCQLPGDARQAPQTTLCIREPLDCSPATPVQFSEVPAEPAFKDGSICLLPPSTAPLGNDSLSHLLTPSWPPLSPRDRPPCTRVCFDLHYSSPTVETGSKYLTVLQTLTFTDIQTVLRYSMFFIFPAGKQKTDIDLHGWETVAETPWQRTG